MFNFSLDIIISLFSLCVYNQPNGAMSKEAAQHIGYAESVDGAREAVIVRCGAFLI
jgi:hypothetical protein